jgi:hypothetical protein
LGIGFHRNVTESCRLRHDFPCMVVFLRTRDSDRCSGTVKMFDQDPDFPTGQQRYGIGAA